MKLYHGTNIDFDRIDLAKSNQFKDFGKGFYLTDIKQQAVMLSQKRADRDGGIPVVQTYEFDEGLLDNSTLKVLRFDNPTEVYIHAKSKGEYGLCCKVVSY